MPQVIPFIVGHLMAHTLLALVIRTVLVNVVLGALVKALSPSQAKQFAPPINVMVRSTTENRRLVFGTTRASCALVYYGINNSNGVTVDPNYTQKYLFYVVAVAGHQISSFGDVWIDKDRIPAGNITFSTGVITGKYASKMAIWGFTGTSTQTVSTIMQGAFGTSFWPSTMKLQGIAYLVVRMERDDTIFPNGAPQNINVKINGALLYDPRLDTTNGGSGAHRYADATTWAFSHNPVLALRWYLTGGSVTNTVATPQVMYGPRELNTRMDDAFTIAAANHCDETLTGANTTPDGDQIRYACDLEVSTGESRRDIINKILATCAGRAVYVHGKWQISVGVYDAPLYSFTEADLYGEMEIQDTTPHTERFNAVAAVFRDQLQEYVEATTPFRVDTGYETQDGSERIPREIELMGVRDRYHAQRLCEIEKRKSRQMRTIKMRGALNLMKVSAGDTFNLSFTRYGWVNRVFRCVDKSFDFQQESGQVVITARAEASSVYTDLITADYITPTQVIASNSAEAPDPASNVLTVSQTDAILVKWTASTTPGCTYELEQSTAFAMTSPTVIYAGADSQAYIDRTATSILYFRVRAKRNGIYSQYSPTSNGVQGAALGVTVTLNATVTPASVTGSGSGTSQTTGAAVVTASGGTSPYTYAWTWASGGASITITSTTAASTTFSTTGLTLGSTVSGSARCTVTDNVSATKTVDVAVSITNGPPLTVTAAPNPTVKTKLDHSGGSVNVTTDASTIASASGGTGAGFTYAWTFVSGDTITCNSTATASTTWTASLTQSQVKAAYWRVTATDSGSHTATYDVYVEITRDLL